LGDVGISLGCRAKGGVSLTLSFPRCLVASFFRYIPLYNFYRAIDKKNLMGLQKYKLHPDRMESQELNDRVTGGLAIGFWKGAVRTAMAYWVFFSRE
jgi:hypothetical protein